MAKFKFKISYNGYSYIHTVHASNKLDAWAKINAHIKSRFKGDLQYEVDCENINNNTYNNMSKKDSSLVVNFDFQGWPEYKHTIKDLIIAFGGVYNEETKNWEIPDSEDLNICPRLVEDDGMGYGVNEQYIIETDFNKDDGYCNIWHDKELDYAQVYVENGVNPGYIFKEGDNEYVIEDVIKDNNGELKFQCGKWDFEKVEEAYKDKKKYSPEQKLFSLEYIKSKTKIEN